MEKLGRHRPGLVPENVEGQADLYLSTFYLRSCESTYGGKKRCMEKVALAWYIKAKITVDLKKKSSLKSENECVPETCTCSPTARAPGYFRAGVNISRRQYLRGTFLRRARSAPLLPPAAPPVCFLLIRRRSPALMHRRNDEYDNI